MTSETLYLKTDSKRGVLVRRFTRSDGTGYTQVDYSTKTKNVTDYPIRNPQGDLVWDKPESMPYVVRHLVDSLLIKKGI